MVRFIANPKTDLIDARARTHTTTPTDIRVTYACLHGAHDQTDCYRDRGTGGTCAVRAYITTAVTHVIFKFSNLAVARARRATLSRPDALLYYTVLRRRRRHRRSGHRASRRWSVAAGRSSRSESFDFARAHRRASDTHISTLPTVAYITPPPRLVPIYVPVRRPRPRKGQSPLYSSRRRSRTYRKSVVQIQL